jgi:hypothetical protein
LFKLVSQLTEQHRWLPFVLPFAVYSLLGQFEPQPPASNAGVATAVATETARTADSEVGFALSLDSYPFYYAIRIAITAGVALLFWSSYTPTPVRVHRLSWLVGIIGVVVWIGLCRLDWESAMLAAIGQSTMGARPSYDPFTQLGGSPTALVTFLAIRFVGLSCVVPLIEEFFLRGFVMRYFLDVEWWKIPIGSATPAAVAIGTAYAVTSHPAEAIAAACWFSLVTWWVAKRGNIWDGIAVHATTNFLLGVYILITRDWTLW